MTNAENLPNLNTGDLNTGALKKPTAEEIERAQENLKKEIMRTASDVAWQGPEQCASDVVD